MPLLEEYEQRTAWKYEPVRGTFCTHEGLTAKVRPDGSYAPFAGSTVVFRPGKLCRQVIPLIQQVTAEKLDGTDMLAEPLPASTVHMTLHDLVSPETCSSDPKDESQYNNEINTSLERAARITEEIRNAYAGRKITLVADRIANMVSKSLVLMMKPRTEQDYELLLEMYRRFETVTTLPYPLTPHITLAYFKPGMIDGDRLGEALDYLQIRPENAPVFDFYPEALTAQRFADMQTYSDLPVQICFCCDGGMNRSVMAANILNHLAEKRGLPARGEARSAYENTQGRPVPEAVWEVLEKNGITPDKSYANSRYLEEREYSHYTAFAAITAGAVSRLSWMRVPEEQINDISRYFYGVPDPEYGEISHGQAFAELYERAERYLDALKKRSDRRRE